MTDVALSPGHLAVPALAPGVERRQQPITLLDTSVSLMPLSQQPGNRAESWQQCDAAIASAILRCAVGVKGLACQSGATISRHCGF
ncbi:hypothetical protein KCP69_02405 [Salmonella enterica subsp. enterica]|nr:hypothetical protein KCP69_02405 [Salmonella enterica subsp. enterica]